MKTRIKLLSAVVLLITVAITALSFPIRAVSIPTFSIVSVPILAFPKAPGDLTGKSWVYLFSDWRVKLEWKDNSSNETGFKIYRRSVDSMLPNFNLIGTVAANTMTYNDAAAELGETYYYYVRAYNSIGEGSSETISVAVTDTAPQAPTDLKAMADSESEPTKVKITWNDQSDNESGFKILRRDSAGSTSFKLIKTLNVNVENYVDNEITPDLEGRYYTYRVSAFNSIDETTSVTGEYSVPFCLKAPADLSAAITSTTADLTWTDKSEKESYFAVYRCTDGVSYQLVAGTGHTAAYHDTNLNPNTLYYYAVCAVYEAEPSLGSPRTYVTAKTALASSGPSSSGSTGSVSSAASVSSAGISSQASSSAASVVTSAAASSVVSELSSAVKSAASSKTKSSAQTVSAVSETRSETFDVISSDGVTSGVASQEGQSGMTAFLEGVRQNGLIIIMVLLAAILVVMVTLLIRKKSKTK